MDLISIEWFLVGAALAIGFTYFWSSTPKLVSGAFKRLAERPLYSILFLIALGLLLNVLGAWDWSLFQWLDWEIVRPLSSLPLFSLWSAVIASLIVLAVSVWPLWIALSALFLLSKKS